MSRPALGAIDPQSHQCARWSETFVPAMNVLAMPFLFRSIEHLQKVLDGPIGNEILGSFEPYGFVGLAFYDSGRAIDLQQRQAGPLDRRHQGLAAARAAIRN